MPSSALQLFSYIFVCHSFAQADIHDAAPGLIDILLKKIEAAGTPDKVAENDHLMKCMSLCAMKDPLIKNNRYHARYYYRSTNCDSYA